MHWGGWDGERVQGRVDIMTGGRKRDEGIAGKCNGTGSLEAFLGWGGGLLREEYTKSSWKTDSGIEETGRDRCQKEGTQPEMDKLEG